MQNTPQELPEDFCSGFVSIIGEPNVGKSTLLNALIGQKLAIVTPKPQTTRNRITGVLTTDNYQAIFLDTPGILNPEYALHRYMVQAAYGAMADADVILYMIDGTHPSPEIEASIFEKLQEGKQPVILLINKIDRIPKADLLPLIDAYQHKRSFAEIVPISATREDGIPELLNALPNYLPDGTLYYPPDIVSELPLRFFVAETIREKVFLRTRQEVPYASTVVIEEFAERPKKTYIRAVIYVERETQKGILIGKQGQAIKDIGRMARQDIEIFLEESVFLELRVLVEPKWRTNTNRLRELGYAF